MLKPEEIETKTFSKAIRGYKVEEVDSFLDEVFATFKELSSKIDKMGKGGKSSSEKEFEKKSNEIEETRNKIIEEAKVAAREIIEAAIEKAKDIVGEE
jgi:cell division initiation protein